MGMPDGLLGSKLPRREREEILITHTLLVWFFQLPIVPPALSVLGLCWL